MICPRCHKYTSMMIRHADWEVGECCITDAEWNQIDEWRRSRRYKNDPFKLDSYVEAAI